MSIRNTLLLLLASVLSNFLIPFQPTAFGQQSSEAETALPSDIAVFKSRVGKWDRVEKTWSGTPGDAPTENKGVSEFRFVFNGRFLQEDYVAKVGDESIRGTGYWGFDERKKKFTRVWMDSNSSQTATAEGTLDQKLKTLTLYGQLDSESGEKRDRMLRYELDLADAEKITFKIFDLSIHKDAKVFEAVYTRQIEKSR